MNIWWGSGENGGLSNLARRPFTDTEGRQYVSVEHAYQTWKSGGFDAKVFAHAWKPGMKIRGKRVRTKDGYNIRLMEALIARSFRGNQRSTQILLDTGDAVLTHNQDRGIWRLEFPRILMDLRATLRGEGQ